MVSYLPDGKLLTVCAFEESTANERTVKSKNNFIGDSLRFFKE
jgi:hypothetical protein